MHWYPLQKYHTQIPKNAKITQYSDFVNNLIDIIDIDNEITDFQQPVIESKFPGLTLVPTRMWTKQETTELL